MADREPSTGIEPYNLGGITGFRISRLSNRLMLWAARVYGREFGVSVLEWRITASLGLLGQATASEIADLAVLDKSNVSRTVHRLLERGFVERSDHPDDSRKKVLSLTPEGRALHERIARRSQERETLLFEGWSEADRGKFLSLAERLDARATELVERTQRRQGEAPTAVKVRSGAG